MMWAIVRRALEIFPALREVRVLRWLQDHQCCMCGKPTKRRWSHWACERTLL